jgi:hypothetical protein
MMYMYMYNGTEEECVAYHTTLFSKNQTAYTDFDEKEECVIVCNV